MYIRPINKSFLSNNKFEFSLKRIPNFTFFVQSVNLPGLTLQSTQVNTPFAAVSIPGDIITFGTLTLSFIIDEDMQSWYEIYNWIFQLGNPKSSNKLGTLTQKPGLTNSVTSDATLLIKSNANNPMWKITFNEIYPTDLAGIDFTTTDNQEFVTSSATFNYTYYELTHI
jgi:Tfp pilus tip-associated adhesin PilY1